MKKICVLIGKPDLQPGVQSFAIKLATGNDALVAGILLPPVPVRINNRTSETLNDNELQALIDEQEEHRQQQCESFKTACDQSGVLHETCLAETAAIDFIISESLYADMLLIASAELQEPGGAIPDFALRRLLAQVKCPLLLVPQWEAQPVKTLLLYDGHPSSIHALKIFNYLLPELAEQPVELLQVVPDDDHGLTESKRLISFARCHYPDVTYTVLQGKARTTLPAYLAKIPEPALIVMGAYGRNRISRWLKSSMADTLLRTPGHLLLIAHP